MLKVILMAYCNNVYGCRPIADLAAYDLRYAVMCEYLRPSFNTINRFRTRRLGNEGVKSVFRQLVELMCDEGLIDIEDVYIDGTTLESRASRKQLVWSQQQRAWAESNRAKIDSLVEQVGIAQELDSSSCAVGQPHGDTFGLSGGLRVSPPCDAPSGSPSEAAAVSTSVDAASPVSVPRSDDAASRIVTPDEAAPQESGKKRRGPEVHLSREEVSRLRAAAQTARSAGGGFDGGKFDELFDRLQRADRYREADDLCAGRSGTALTDPESVAMHPKDDVRRIGPCLPMYDAMIATSDQFIVEYGLYGVTTDTSAYPHFLSTLAGDYTGRLKAATADAAFGSMVNVLLSGQAGITPYFKHSWYDREHHRTTSLTPTSPKTSAAAGTGFQYVPAGTRCAMSGPRKRPSTA